MKFIVNVDRHADGQWIAECPTVPGCSATGATKEEALAHVEERIRQFAPERLGGNMPLTVEVEEPED